jgi:hypothetical protein
MMVKRALIAWVLASCCLAGPAAAHQWEIVMSQAPPQGMQPARDGDIAIREELDMARRAGTTAAYDRFLTRHGNHPLAEAARRERDRLATSRKR